MLPDVRAFFTQRPPVELTTVLHTTIRPYDNNRRPIVFASPGYYQPGAFPKTMELSKAGPFLLL
jgi:hypothetical protein